MKSYLIANNRDIPIKRLRFAPVKSGDVVILQNLFIKYKMLPKKWEGVKYILVIRNILLLIKKYGEKRIRREILTFNPVTINFLNDAENDFDKDFADSLRIKYSILSVPESIPDYPGLAPSTGFIALHLFPKATLINFNSNNGIDNFYPEPDTIWHNWKYERAFIANNRKNILV